jgi:predicted metal-dependent phosphotriesterase family hydrolase
MSFVRTVLGDVPASALGRTYAHEHLIINEGYVVQLFPDLLLPSAEKAAEELASCKAAGLGSVVETLPCDAGRDVLKLAEASRRSGVNLIAPTGLHLPRFYPKGHWRFRMSAEELAELFTEEVERGIDANDGAGPGVRRTSHRAGIVKVGSAARGLDAAERAAFEAAAATHRRAGCPIITHVEPGLGFDQIELLVARGVPPGKITLSHTDRTPDRDYHRALLKTGANLEYDRVFRHPLGPENPSLRLYAEMIREFPGQVMLGTDGARAAYWRSYGGGPGLDYLLRGFSELARGLGVSAELLDRTFVDTPARAFSFA